MAQFTKADLWLSQANLLVVSTCGVLTYEKELVMGRGIAAQAKRWYPGIPKAAGHAILNPLPDTIWSYGDTCYIYGFRVAQLPNVSIGLFQSKIHWKDLSSLSLIGYSVVQLTLWMEANARDRGYRVAMNFPGIGLGGLPHEQVLPILRELNDRVTVHDLRWDTSSL